MKKIIFAIAVICSSTWGFAQTSQFKAKLNRSDEPINLRMDQVSANIEGYDGDDIIIESVPAVPGPPPLASGGLKQITLRVRDKEDNIIKPRLQEDESGMRITIPPGKFSRLNIKVPQTAILFVTLFAYFNNSVLSVNNVNVVDIGGVYSSLFVNNVSGFSAMVSDYHMGMRGTGKFKFSNIRWTDQPITINGQQVRRSYRVNSFNSDIEMDIPNTITGNIITLSEFGRVFSNLNFNPLPSSARDIRAFGRQFTRDPGQAQPPVTTIALNNAGGFDIIVGSTYGDIMLKAQL